MRTLKIENYIAYKAKWDEKDYECGAWTVIEEYQDREITGIRIIINGKSEKYLPGNDKGNDLDAGNRKEVQAR